MKKYTVVLLVMTFWIPVVSAQQGVIKLHGKVMTAGNDPVPAASVKVKNDKYGTTTDSSGSFRLEVSALPISLLISHTNYEAQEITVSSANDEIVITFASPRWDINTEVVLQSKGIPTSILNYTSSAEFIGLNKIRQLPTLSPYDATVYSKGIDLTTSSLMFKTPSTRGFNGSGSTRVNQIVDGMDNQAPGLNFFVGNFTGPTDLDVESIELLPGASSALYGPGGMNGTILINSKNPFKHQGLSVQARQGIMHVDKKQRDNATPYYDYSLRWAKAFNDKFAFKIGAQYISAKDWLATDSSNYDRTGTTGKLIAGNRQTDPNYDGVNVYGDETSLGIKPIAQYMEFLGLLPGGASQLVPDENVSRTGYAEKDVIDPETKNIRLSGALHYKINPGIEAQLMANWSTGNTVYTDDNRYALKDIKIAQYKLELKHKDWFLRAYTTQENAGEAYSATIATQYFNESWKASQVWYPEYIGAFVTSKSMGASNAQAHTAGRTYADRNRPEAGSAQFRHLFDSIRNVPIPKGGLFKEKSQLWMGEGQYRFAQIKFADIIVGGNYKRYVLNSDGTIFIDTLKPITINEVGAYIQVSKKFFDDKLTLVGSCRYDKNENFNGQFTPRIAALVNVAKDNNLRFSYQTAYRFPSNLTQWIRLDVGSDYLLLGGLPWVMDYMNAKENPVFLINDDGSVETTPYAYKQFKPETMRSFEIGYKGFIHKRLLIDAYAYTGSYKDFVGRIGLYQPATDEAFSIVVNSKNKVKTHGFGLGIDYRMNHNYSLFFNAYSDVITDVPAGFKSYFNTPKYRFNAGLGNSGLGKSKRTGFNIMMRWQDAFEWEGELANGPLASFTTVDAQVSYKFPAIKSVLRIGGTNIFNSYYKNAYANPEIGGLYYASFIYNL